MSLRYLLRKQSGVPPVGKSGRHFPGCTSVREPQQEPVRVQVPVPLQEPLQEPVQVQVPTDRVKFLEPVRKARMPWIFILVLLISAISISRSEEHTSELQSRGHLVCRLLLEKKKTNDD